MKIETLLPQFQRAGAELRAAGLVSSHGGNLSVWTPEGVLITRDGAMLGSLSAEDICLVGRKTLPPPVDPALDTPIHLAAYVFSKARAIMHATPAYAIALSLAMARQSFAEPTGAEMRPLDNAGRHLLRTVPVLKHTRDIVREVGESLNLHPVVMVTGHGCYARGTDLLDALRYLTLFASSAEVLYLHRRLLTGLPSASSPSGLVE